MVAELRVVIEVNTMDRHLHMLTAYVNSKFTGKCDRKLLIFSMLVTVTIGLIWMNNNSYLGLWGLVVKALRY